MLSFKSVMVLAFYILVYEPSQINSGGWCEIRIKVCFSHTDAPFVWSVFLQGLASKAIFFQVRLSLSEAHRLPFPFLNSIMRKLFLV